MEEARQKEIVAVKPIVTMLKETGWYFGSHSWGHISLSTSNLKTVKEDMSRWLNEVGSLVGSTKLFFYPFGARPDGDDVQQSGEIFKYLQAKGFRVFASVGYESYSKIKSDICAVICDRSTPTATRCALARKIPQVLHAKLVFDYDVRPDYGTAGHKKQGAAVKNCRTCFFSLFAVMEARYRARGSSVGTGCPPARRTSRATPMFFAERAHNLQPLEVFFHVLRHEAVHVVPVLRRHDRHLHDCEVLVDPVERGARAAPAAADDGRRGLVAQLWPGRHEHPV
jgi:hypothetical protein